MQEKLPCGLKIAIIDRAFKRIMDKWASDMELTFAQVRVLTEISDMEDKGISEINQKDLERYEKVSHPTMTGILQRLESKGFVKCCTSEVDKRFKKISCTEKSVGMNKKLEQKDNQIFKEICKGFSENEIKTFNSFLDRIIENISADDLNVLERSI